MANVTLEGVKKIYDRQVVAVQEFNLSIADKEFVVFVGPSGCGKSTTLRMIAGLEDISEGTIRIGGRIVNDVEPKDRNIAMVFQNYALYPHLTVYENLAFSLRIRKMKQEEIHRRVCQAAEILGITPYLGRKPKALSGGQRQRVAIGRAIVRDADVFLMDEPLSNLDAKLRSQMRAEIILLRKRINTTFIYVTHDQTEAMTLGDRIVIMRDGFIQQVGTPQEVFDKPANLFVAGFIGSPPMNILPGQLVMNGGRCLLSLPGADIPLPERLEQELMSRQISPQNVLAGIRPEHVSVCFQPGPDALTGRITVQEMMGSELHLHVLLPGENKMVLRLPTMHLSPDQRALLQADQPVHFTLPGKALHLFDPQTEKNLLA